jgi:hypothetical protein
MFCTIISNREDTNMINDPRMLYRRFILGTAGLTALATLLRTLALCLFFDRAVGYIDSNIFSTLLYITLPLMVLWCAGYALLAARGEKATLLAIAPDEASASPVVRYTALGCALTFVGAMLAELLLFGFDGTPSLLRYLAAIAATLYFTLPKTGGSILLGLGIPLYAVTALASEYFDWTVPLNSPIKLMQTAALLSTVLFVMVELNHLNHTRRSVRYTVCAALSLFCGLSNSLPLLAAALAGGIVKPAYLIHALPALAVGLYAAARLLASHEIDLPEPTKESEAEQATDEQTEDKQSIDSQDAPTLTSQEEESHG